MKRSNKLFILLGILLVCVVLTVVVLKTEEKKEIIKNTDEIVLEIDPDSVKTLEWDHVGPEDEPVHLAFTRIDGHWHYDDDDSFPVDDEKVQTLLEDFRELGATFIIEDVEDFAQYGMDDPECTVHIGTDKKDYTIVMGAYSTMDAQRYVSIGDGKVYLTKVDPAYTYSRLLSDMVKFDEMPKFDEVTEIRFGGENNYRIFREENSAHSYCVSDKYFAEINGQILPLDTEAVENYLYALHTITFEKYRTYNMSEEEAVAFGLNDPQLTVEVDYADLDEETGELGEPQKLRFYMGRDLDEKTRRDAAAEAGEGLANLIVTAYVRLNDSGLVYSIKDEKCTRLLKTGYEFLRHKSAMPADFDATVESFEATLDGNTYAFTTEKDENETFRKYFFEGERFEGEPIRIYTGNIAAADETGYTDEVPTGVEEISMVFHLNDPNYPEVRLACYRYDGVKCLVTVDGTPFCFTERKNVVNLRESVFAVVLGGAEPLEED